MAKPGINKLKKSKKEGDNGRCPTLPGSDSLEHLRTMARRKEHTQKLLSVLLLREVRLLLESEMTMQRDICALMAILAARDSRCAAKGCAARDDNKNREGESCDEAASEVSAKIVLTEPVASLFGVNGADGDTDHSSRADETAMKAPHDEAAMQQEQHATGPTGPPPVHRRCFRCTHMLTNTSCPLCAFNNAQNKAKAVTGT